MAPSTLLVSIGRRRAAARWAHLHSAGSPAMACPRVPGLDLTVRLLQWDSRNGFVANERDGNGGLVSSQLGVTRERVRQIEGEALVRLRRVVGG